MTSLSLSSISPPPIPEPVTLDNCASEPIHLPGHIQPHGALLMFGLDGTLAGWSANTHAILGFAPELDVRSDRLPVDADVLQLLDAGMAEAALGETWPLALETTIGGQSIDCVVHHHDDRLIAEFELRDQPKDVAAAFALKAHSAIDRLKRQKTLPALLQMAVEQVRSITGFDRVMAYRFRHDDSGDVVAEARREDLSPYLGMRYPASDIPPQARHLYTINTLRLIADVGYEPVPVLGRALDAPLDMSHSVLRSVSPIHIEYLHNIGVEASMSVSIVVNGRLWGLIACHHTRPHRVPFSIRMACDVLAQVLAATVQNLAAQQQAKVVEQAADVRTRLVETLLHEDDVRQALALHAHALCTSLGSAALIISNRGTITCHGDVSEALAAAIIESFKPHGKELLWRGHRREWPAAMQDDLGKWVGALGLHFDPANDGWLVALRPEQIEDVRWGGDPSRKRETGPLGTRLTPDGSFKEWRDTVRDMSEPWDKAHVLVAEQLLAEIYRACMTRHADMERARMHLLAMLGHDLRTPLHSISMAAMVLEKGGEPRKLASRIQASTSRMQRLINQVIDMSQIHGPAGLRLSTQRVLLAALIEDLLDESRVAYPGVVYEVDLSASREIEVDPYRMEQVISNLISNARQHSGPGAPIQVALSQEGDQARIEVRNTALAIAPALANALFDPFTRAAAGIELNRSGMGLGLYIAKQIVAGHRGRIAYHHDGSQVVFVVNIPLRLGDPALPAR